ncbi:MAG: hypothetical protein ABI306_11155, partial [Caulobacteraceae bacterium]
AAALLLAETPVAGTAQAPAAVQALNADLLAHASATEVLQRRCTDRHLADPPVIRAIRVRGADKVADAQVRALLRASPGEIVRYRHVRLVCGARVLSDADNWYRPARLTADMNRRLDTTDTPFGAVVRPLDFHRRTIAVAFPDRASGPYILRHRAVLVTAAGVPFSVVEERYTREAAGVTAPDR